MGPSFAAMGETVYLRCMRIIDTVNVAYTTQSMEVTVMERVKGRRSRCRTRCSSPPRWT